VLSKTTHGGISAEKRNAIVLRHQGLVHSIASKALEEWKAERRGDPWHIEYDDLVQIGNLAFIHSIDTYKPGAQSVTTWAHPHIRKEIMLALDEGRRIDIPVGLMDDDDWPDAA
jgi:RNA polymerase sigma factor (sigma-70 family)